MVTRRICLHGEQDCLMSQNSEIIKNRVQSTVDYRFETNSWRSHNRSWPPMNASYVPQWSLTKKWSPCSSTWQVRSMKHAEQEICAFRDSQTSMFTSMVWRRTNRNLNLNSTKYVFGEATIWWFWVPMPTSGSNRTISKLKHKQQLMTTTRSSTKTETSLKKNKRGLVFYR